MIPFVGRQAELSALGACLADACAGRPRIVQIQGPAGIGKTALLEQFLSAPDTVPAPVVVSASGEETESLLAYGVVHQLLHSLAVEIADEPAKDGRVQHFSPGPEDRSEGIDGVLDDPVTVGMRLLGALDGVGAHTLVITVDDVQWVDRPSLQALIFALRRLVADQVLAVLTVRDDRVADLPESLRRLVRGQRGMVLHLRGLDEDDLRHLATEMGIDRIGPATARRLRAGTRGNPLHARALLEEFPPSDWGNEDRPLPSPRSFRRLVRDRYAACSEPARRVVDATAVLGQNSPVPVVGALAEVAEPLEPIDEAIRFDLLRVREADSPWTLSIPHPLIQAALYEALGPARRHALHSAAAGLVSDEAAALRHRVAAAAEPDEALAADLTAFADREERRLSWQSAAAHLIAASRLSPDPRQGQRRVLQAVAWTMLRGDAATATDYAREVASYPSSPLREAVLGSLAMAAEDPERAQALLERAWAQSRLEDDPEVAALVAVMTAIHWYGRLDAGATVHWCETALARLAGGSESSTTATSVRDVAVTYLVHGLGYAGRTAESVAAAQPSKALDGQVDQRWLNPRSARGLLRLVDDDLEGARTDLESVAQAAAALGILNTAAFSYAYLARTEWMLGAWDDALVHADRAVAINAESDFGFMQSAVTGIAVLVPACRGDWDTAESYLRMLPEVFDDGKGGLGYERSVIALSMSRARLGESRGRPADVLAALDPVRRFPNRDAVEEPGFWAWQDLFADALVALGRTAEADEFLVRHETLAEARGRRTAIARLARSRGRVEAAAGRRDRAEAAFTRALEAVDGLSVPFERARIELAAGQFLRRVGQRRRAADLLENARGRFAQLGAVPYAQRCVTELAASGLTPAARGFRDHTELTSQELVVARLAALGRSNKEIAAELVVSIKTIEYHLRNAFGKLGVTSRRQLADRLGDQPGLG